MDARTSSFDFPVEGKGSVMRNSLTWFHCHGDAEKAIKNLRHSPIRIIRVKIFMTLKIKIPDIQNRHNL